MRLRDFGISRVARSSAARCLTSRGPQAVRSTGVTLSTALLETPTAAAGWIHGEVHCWDRGYRSG